MFAVYITCKDKKEARKIAKLLLEKKLIVCANLFPIESHFWWHGKLEEAAEYAILAKTKDSLLDAIKELVHHAHSYEVPVITAWKELSNSAAEKWLESELR
ncbi:MAG TPA: divalent-cation tolerance protein CutA [Candidatus Nanoarchaeia archaeon]|nr:divalent-cation tolerance protein CutA [Candidatus Nanoarchaeia archaeon]